MRTNLFHAKQKVEVREMKVSSCKHILPDSITVIPLLIRVFLFMSTFHFRPSATFAIKRAQKRLIEHETKDFH